MNSCGTNSYVASSTGLPDTREFLGLVPRPHPTFHCDEKLGGTQWKAGWGLGTRLGMSIQIILTIVYRTNRVLIEKWQCHHLLYTGQITHHWNQEIFVQTRQHLQTLSTSWLTRNVVDSLSSVLLTSSPGPSSLAYCVATGQEVWHICLCWTLLWCRHSNPECRTPMQTQNGTTSWDQKAFFLPKKKPPSMKTQ